MLFSVKNLFVLAAVACSAFNVAATATAEPVATTNEVTSPVTPNNYQTRHFATLAVRDIAACRTKHDQCMKAADKKCKGKKAKCDAHKACGDALAKCVAKYTATPEQEKNGDSCAICLDDFIAGVTETKRLQCGHYFDKECINKWLAQGANCPMCRQ